MCKDTGGPAFPFGEVTDHGGDTVTYAEPGMTLRDYVAAKAMEGLLAGGKCKNMAPEGVSFSAYKYADAMLLERAK